MLGTVGPTGFYLRFFAQVISEIKMVVGLGNPGREYANTRHNVGFRVIDSLAVKLQVAVNKRKFGARFGSGWSGGKKLILLKPWQFMNRSGEAVAKAMAFYKVGIDDLLVVSDDMALAIGVLRIRKKGSAGGHNGLADVIEKLGTEKFNRLRVGIGSKESGSDVDYVLDGPNDVERPLLREMIERAAEAVICWTELGIEEAMNGYNRDWR
jgi:PTH1 family peptidyl-tRNA hydrolase